MHALIVYESIYGSTHKLAVAVASGLRRAGPVKVVPVTQARHERLADYDLVVVGGPTHAHGMSRRSTRQAAIDTATGGAELASLEPGSGGIGLREWLDGLGACRGAAAAFDTRLPGPVLLTGRASKGIADRLEAHGFRLVAEPTSFIVDGHNHLVPRQESEAEQWGAALAAAFRASQLRAPTRQSQNSFDPPKNPARPPVQF